MSPTSQKSKTSSPWVQCEDCSSFLDHKYTSEHKKSCPPDIKNPPHPLISNRSLYGVIDVKTNEEIKSTTAKDRKGMVFLSQSVFQLCGFAIGDWCVINSLDGEVSAVRTVWPTIEKTLTSVLFTKSGLPLAGFEHNQRVVVEKLQEDVIEASQLSIVILNAPKRLEFTPELRNRLHREHVNRIVCENNKLSVLYYGKVLVFEIKSLAGTDEDLNKKLCELSLNEKRKHYRIVENTGWNLYKDSDNVEITQQKTLLRDIGGLDDELEELQHLMYTALGKKDTIKGFKYCRGVLLYGSSGTGKTMLANALAESSNVNVIKVCAPDLYAKSTGKVEEMINNLFDEAIECAPSVIVLDEVDLFCPVRSGRLTDTDKKIVSSLLLHFDRLNQLMDCKVFVLGTTNKIDGIDGAFRRCGRFDREIEIPVPSPKARFDILKKILKATQINEEDLREAAYSAHGFVGADLISLCSRAALNTSKRNASCLNLDDFKFALHRVRPSAMREVQIEISNVKWTDIGGQEHLKLILKQAIEWPLKHPDNFLRMGITPPRGVLMFGPPGCSKTMIAKALATESGLNFLSIKGPELFSKWVGESERAVREVFRKARQVAPSIIFFDEIDALGGERSSGSSTSVQERVLAQLLTELDGVSPLGDVTVLAATNRPDRIDKALLRPGRLDRIVYVPLPDEETRKEIFKIKFKKMPILNVEIEELVSLTKGYSGAEVNAVCHEAAMVALEESLEAQTIQMRHFKKALDLVKSRTSPNLLKIYEDYVNNKS